MDGVSSRQLCREGNVQRVAVIGNAGGGKSTLTRTLGEVFGLPIYPVDQVQWRPGWRAVPNDEVMAKLDALASGSRWIIDGWGPWPTIERRFTAADTIIVVDHPVWVHFWWAAERQIACARGDGRPDGPDGCDMLDVTPRLFKMIWDIDQNLMPRLRRLTDAVESGRIVHRITSPEALNSFRAEIQTKPRRSAMKTEL